MAGAEGHASEGLHDAARAALENRTRIRPYTAREVAAILEWSEASVRRHMVEIHEWRRRGGHASGLVPFVRRGKLQGIPVAWVLHALELATSGEAA